MKCREQRLLRATALADGKIMGAGALPLVWARVGLLGDSSLEAVPAPAVLWTGTGSGGFIEPLFISLFSDERWAHAHTQAYRAASSTAALLAASEKGSKC